jgi:hypothetical protein
VLVAYTSKHEQPGNLSAYLDIVDVVSVPVGAKEFVAKSENQNVLDHLLTEVVVNTEDLLLLPVGLQGVLEFSRAAKVFAERLLNLRDNQVSSDIVASRCMILTMIRAMPVLG